MAMQRAEDKTERMQARAQALDELIDSGALEDATLPAGRRDDIQAALDAARDTGGVDRELAALKGALTAPATRPALDRADPAASSATDAAPPNPEREQPRDHPNSR
jgi:phage shock protein A